MAAIRVTSDEDLLAALGPVQIAVNEAWAAMLPLVAEIEARGLAAARGHRDTAELLRET